MFFPSNMTFQYFLFNTYPGYFLQVLPIAVLAAIVYWIIGLHKKEMPTGRKVSALLFVCYITGLVCLVLLIDVIGDLWYKLLYHMDSGMLIRLFSGEFDFHPDFTTYFYDGERLMNFLMFIPFGILYPLSRQNTNWRKTILVGFLSSLVIEMLQPVFGRAFDIDDLILNTLGILISATVLFAIKGFNVRAFQRNAES